MESRAADSTDNTDRVVNTFQGPGVYYTDNFGDFPGLNVIPTSAARLAIGGPGKVLSA